MTAWPSCGFLSHAVDGRTVKEFGFHTDNARARVFEEGALDGRRGTPFHLMYGGADGSTVTVATRSPDPAQRRHRWTMGEGRVHLTVEHLESPDWISVFEGSFQRVQ